MIVEGMTIFKSKKMYALLTIVGNSYSGTCYYGPTRFLFASLRKKYQQVDSCELGQRVIIRTRDTEKRCKGDLTDD